MEEICAAIIICASKRRRPARPHLAGRAFVCLFFHWFPAALGLFVVSVEENKTSLCAWANEELFDTFPGFGASGVDSAPYVNPFAGNFTSFERALRCQFKCRRSDRPDVGFSLFFSRLLFLAVGYAGQPAPKR